MKRFSRALGLFLVAGICGAGAADGDWRNQLTPPAAAPFPALPPVRMEFRFGWSNVLEAANAEATIQLTGNEYRAKASGQTKGLAGVLWPLDARHTTTILAESLQPREISQIERYRRRSIETKVRYDATGLDRFRQSSDAENKAKWKRLNFSPVFDVIGGVLFVRSQPLRVGDVVSLVTFPGDSPYVATVRVEGRETVLCMGREWPALRLALEVRKLEVEDKKPTKAVDYAKFRSGTIWVSDDDLRLPLRAEVNVMVGFVYGELSAFERR